MPQPGRSGLPFQKRRRGAQVLADLVAPSLGPVLSRQGFSEADVLMQWADIVGADLAAHCQPLKLQWRRASDHAQGAATPPATMVVRVEGAFAVRLQHMAPVVVERVNTHFGWACVGKLALRQGPLPKAPPKRQSSPPDPATARRASDLASGVVDDGLRAALTRLGSRVLHREPRRAKAEN